VEPLEDRQLLSVTASLSDGLLSVIGDAAGDAMVVRQADNQITVVGTEYSFAADAINSLDVQGLAGNHVIDVRGVSKPSTLSGPGNDRFLIDLTSPVTLPAYNATDQITFSDPVLMYRVRIDGSVWALRRDGLLYGSGQLIDSGVLSFDITPHGVVYELNAMQGGVLLSGWGTPGTFQQIGPGNTRAFAMAPDGTAYALSLDGVLRRNQGADGGNCDIVVDSGVLAFAISPYGVVYELNAMQGGVLLNSGTGNPGTFQQIGPGNTRAFAMAPDGTAYALSADGVLRRNGGGLGGNCTEVVDTGVLQVAISPAGVVTELNAMQGGVLLNSGTGNPGTFQQIGPGNTRAFAMAPIGTIYALGADGILRRNGPLGGNCLEVVDTSVLQVAISSAGVVTELNAMQGGVLLNGWGDAGGFEQIGPGNTRAFAMAPIGTIYALGADSILRRNGPLGGNCLEWVDSGVLQVAVSPAGVVYELNAMQGGVLLNGWGGAGGFQQIGPGNTRAFAMAPIGTAYALGADGVLRRNGGGLGGNCLEVVDTGVLQVAISPAGVVTELNSMQGGVLLNSGTGAAGTFQQIGPGNTRAFAMAPIGTIYALGIDGVLRSNGPLGGNCLTVVGSGIFEFAMTPQGALLALGEDTVVRYSAADHPGSWQVSTTPGFSSLVTTPSGALILGRDGTVWYSATGLPNVWQVSTTPGFTALVTTLSGALILSGSDGTVWYSATGLPNVWQISTSPGFVSLATTLSGALILGRDGTAWYSQTGLPNVWQISTSPGFVSLATTPSGALILSRSGTVWYSPSGMLNSWQVSTTTGFSSLTTTIAGALILGSDGTVWYSAHGMPNSWQISTSSGFASLAVSPGGVAFIRGRNGGSLWSSLTGRPNLWQLCALSGLSNTQGTVGRSYSGSVTVSGDAETLTDLTVTGAGLGGALAGNTINLSGTLPTRSDTYTIGVSVTFGNIPWATVSATYQLTVNPGPVSQFIVSAPSTATVGSRFQVTVTAVDGYGNTAHYNGVVTLVSSHTDQVSSASFSLTDGIGSTYLTPSHSGEYLHEGPVAFTVIVDGIARSGFTVTVNPSAYLYTFWGQAFDGDGHLIATTVWSNPFANLWVASQAADQYFAWWFQYYHFDHVRYGLQSVVAYS
jgi:hypothetical protein